MIIDCSVSNFKPGVVTFLVKEIKQAFETIIFKRKQTIYYVLLWFRPWRSRLPDCCRRRASRR